MESNVQDRDKEKQGLRLKDVRITLKEGKKRYPAVKGVSLSVIPGRNTGIIGESGCGKSLLCHSILGILSQESWETAGEFYYQNRLLTEGRGGGRPGFCGTYAGFIAQDPAAAFDPRMILKKHFTELAGPLGMKRDQILPRAGVLLKQMGIQDPEHVLRSYSFQLSGGMLQRVMIALALIGEPKLLIADEPTTALDATTRMEILKLLKEMKGLSVLMVSHDLRAVAQIADDIYVMYAGYIVEQGEAAAVLEHPAHPYTRGLLASRPSFSKEPIQVMEGYPPGIHQVTEGCPFAPRCRQAEDRCRNRRPALAEYQAGNGGSTPHLARCFRAGIQENDSRGGTGHGK